VTARQPRESPGPGYVAAIMRSPALLAAAAGELSCSRLRGAVSPLPRL